MTTPDENAVKEFYDQEYYGRISTQSKPTRHHVQLAKRLNIKFDDQVLDVACGTGNWLMATQQLGARITGIDLSHKAIDFCRGHFPNGHFTCQSATSLPYANNSFDLVTCLGSLEHFPTPLEAVKEMVRVAKPNAQILILVPNSDYLGYKLGLFQGTDQTKAIEKPAPLAEWEQLFNQAGMTIESRWKDSHILSRQWILGRGAIKSIIRAAIAIGTFCLPLHLQYQVYFCGKANNKVE